MFGTHLPTLAKGCDLPSLSCAGVSSSWGSVICGDLSPIPGPMGWEPLAAAVRSAKLAKLEETPEPPALSPP